MTEMPPTEKTGGVVLCGGRSSRMGQAKAWLDFGGETALQRVVRQLEEVVSPVVVVSAPGQKLPPLPDAVVVVEDQQEFLGPLAGLAQGLRALTEAADSAYVTACDVPLLKPAFIRKIISRLGQADCALPIEAEFYHPLAGVYRCSLWESARQLVQQNRLRPLFLIETCQSVAIPVEELRACDPHLDSLRNINTPEDYEQVLETLRAAKKL